MTREELKEKVRGYLTSVQRKGMPELIEFLEESDFYTAPASTRFHSSHEGGLLQHVYFVYRILEGKNKQFKLNLPPDTLIIAGLLHDICKVNFYKIEQRWRKDDRGKWESYDAYGYDDLFPTGHGEKSVITLMKYIELTDLEIMMIRWHMGFSIPEKDYPILNAAYEKYPEIVVLHTADLEATKLLEKG